LRSVAVSPLPVPSPLKAPQPDADGKQAKKEYKQTSKARRNNESGEYAGVAMEVCS